MGTYHDGTGRGGKKAAEEEDAREMEGDGVSEGRRGDGAKWRSEGGEGATKGAATAWSERERSRGRRTRAGFVGATGRHPKQRLALEGSPFRLLRLYGLSFGQCYFSTLFLYFYPRAAKSHQYGMFLSCIIKFFIPIGLGTLYPVQP